MRSHSFGVETVFRRARIQIAAALTLALLTALAAAASAAAADLKVETDGIDQGDCRVDACATLGYAIGQAADGDRIDVGPGEYHATAAIVVNKAVTISGAQAGVDARDRNVPAAEETEIIGDAFNGGLLRLNVPGATIDGVTIRGHGHAAIQTLNSSTGYAIRNTIMTDNRAGVYLGSRATDPLPTVIERNRFQSNNRTGLQSGIYGDNAINDVAIEENLFEDHENVPINIAGPTAASRSDIRIAGNEFVRERHVLLLSARDVELTGNTFTDGRTRSISVEGGVDGLRIEGNVIDETVDAGILFTSRYNAGTNTDATITGNSISGVIAGSGGDPFNAGAAILLVAETQGPGYTGALEVERNRLVGNAGGGIKNDLDGVTVEAPDNWWGCNGGPGTAGCDSVSGNVDASPNVVLSIEAAPSRMLAGATAAVTATVGANSAGQPVDLPVLEGRTMAFQATQGAVTPPSGTVTGGSAAAQYTSPTAVGAATVTASFDGEAVGADVFVGAAPALSAAGLSGSGLVGEPLTCAAADVSGLPQPSSATGWLRDGAEIAGQGESTYTPQDSDVGSQIACRVTVANEFGSASADSSAVTIVRRAQTPVKPPVIKPKARVTVPRTGKVVILAVGCPSGNCRIKTPKRVRVRIKGKVYLVKVKAPARLAQGKAGRVRLVLPPRARRAIRGARAKARVKIVITSKGSKRKIINRAFVLRGKPRR